MAAVVQPRGQLKKDRKQQQGYAGKFRDLLSQRSQPQPQLCGGRRQTVGELCFVSSLAALHFL